MASSTEIPLVTLLPRAWIGFSRGPWRCVGLAALVLISTSGPALIGHDLRLAGSPWLNRLGDLSVLISLVLPLLPLLALLQLSNGLLPDRRDDRPQQSWRQLLRQAFTLVLLELVLVLGGVGLIQSLSWALGRWSTALAGLSVLLGGVVLLSWLFSQTLALPLLVHERCRALQAMDHSRQLVHRNGLKLLALLGMLLGLPFSVLVLMACCRPQTPLISDSRRNMFPT
mgnify:CR=1 FL=1